MKKVLLILFVILGISGLTTSSQDFRAQEQVPAKWEQKTYQERGEYLVKHLAECVGCHTPVSRGRPDMKLFLSGVPEKFAGRKKGPPQVAGFRGPKGSRYYSKNLTPDPETGLGNWTEGQFIKAFKEQKRPDGTHYDDSEMPWNIFKNMETEVIQAIYRYLRTIKPIKNRVPANIPPTVRR